MGGIAQYLHPEIWRGWLHAGIDQMGFTAFWFAVLQIIFINVLLSGDNAVVIAMACRGLPQHQRRWGLVIGAAVAIVLRIAFTVTVAELMQLSYLKLIGGAALLYIAAKLLAPEDESDDDVSGVAHLWRAIAVIAIADLVMSLDNVIAVAAAAWGNVLLLTVGLAISIPLIVAGAALIMALLDRFPFLIWAGTALLGWIGGETMATDPAVVLHLTNMFGGIFVQQVEFAAAVAGAVFAVAAGGLWRSLHEAGARAAANAKSAA